MSSVWKALRLGKNGLKRGRGWVRKSVKERRRVKRWAVSLLKNCPIVAYWLKLCGSVKSARMRFVQIGHKTQALSEWYEPFSMANGQPRQSFRNAFHCRHYSSMVKRFSVLASPVHLNRKIVMKSILRQTRPLSRNTIEF